MVSHDVCSIPVQENGISCSFCPSLCSLHSSNSYQVSKDLIYFASKYSHANVKNRRTKQRLIKRGSTNASCVIEECVTGAFLKTEVVTKPFLDTALLFRHSTIFLLCLVALYRQVKEIPEISKYGFGKKEGNIST